MSSSLVRPLGPTPTGAAPPAGGAGRATRRRRVARILAAVVLLAAAAGGFAYWRSKSRKPATRFETVRVERGRVVAKVTASGTLSAIVTVQVGSQVSGRVAALYADYNSPVKKGQLIAKIDPALFDAAVEQARANLVAAQGNLAKAKAQAVDAERQYRRNGELLAERLVSQADLDTAQATAEAARATVVASNGAVAQAKAMLNQAEVNLKYTNILSPTNGVVISRSVDVGQTVAASLQAPTLFVIAEDLAKMQVDTSVAEADVGRLREGMSVTFTVDAYPAEAFTGVVRQIRNSPQTVQNVVTYDAVIDVANPQLKLRPGMTANVTFIYAEKDDVLRVPNAALRFRPSSALAARRSDPSQAAGQAGAAGGRRPAGASSPATGSRSGTETPDRKTVWVLRGDQPERVRIRAGISDGSVTEVVEGELQAGDPVITDASGGTSSASPGGPPPGGMRRLF